jgi:hypothetical protein
MALNEERLRILKKIQEGKITPEEGVKLLDALERGSGRTNPARSSELGEKNNPPKWMRVMITDLKTNREKVNIRLPANVVDAGQKLGACYGHNLTARESDVIQHALNNGEKGKLIDVCDDNSCERVVITLE